MFTVSYRSAGCLPDSDFWPCEFDTLEEVQEFLVSEITIYNDIDIDSDDYANILREVDSLTDSGGIIWELGHSLYAYYVDRWA